MDNNYWYSFCETDKFKKYVRHAVNDELFYSTLIHRLNMNQLIKEELTREVPNCVKREAQLVIGDLAEKKLTHFITYQLGSHIANELNKQIPGYLNNHGHMQQILNHHSQNLNQQLLNSATETLNHLVNEPQYQMVTTSHLNAMQQKCDHQRSTFEMQHDAQLKEHDRIFNHQLTQINNNYQQQMDQLKTNLVKLDNVQTKINQLEKENSCLRWTIGGVSVVFLTSLIGVFFWKQ